MSYLLGVSVSATPKEHFLSRKSYTEHFLKRYGIYSCKSARTPAAKCKPDHNDNILADKHKTREIVGSLLYLSTRARADIYYALNFSSVNVPAHQSKRRFMQNGSCDIFKEQNILDFA